MPPNLLLFVENSASLIACEVFNKSNQEISSWLQHRLLSIVMYVATKRLLSMLQPRAYLLITLLFINK